jgi:hypothetical protein
MSFSTEVKKELSQINNLANKEEVKYELLGYLISANTIRKTRKIKYSTENEYNINRFAKLLRNVCTNDFSIDIQGKVFSIEFKEKHLEDLQLNWAYIENAQPHEFNFKEYDAEKAVCCFYEISNVEYVKALFRGVFMGSGSINNPENTYHLEMGLANKDVLQTLIEIIKKYEITLKSIDNSIYIKDGEEISKFLAFIGASNSVIKFEEIRVQRDMNNKINRLVNCKSANLNKVLNASVEQIEAIRSLKASGKFQNLDDSLKELAELRLEHPDMPLGELGSMLNKPIGKSGVNYRLKKLIELSK